MNAVPVASACSAPAASRRPPWLLRRLFPLLATIVMIVAGMAGTIWGPRFYGKTAWALPDDLWGTMIAAQRLIHLDLSGLYTPPTQLVSLPGAAIILIPVVAIIDLAGLHLGLPQAHGAHPGLWLLAGPYEIAVSAVALFAADALAERLGATPPEALPARGREPRPPCGASPSAGAIRKTPWRPACCCTRFWPCRIRGPAGPPGSPGRRWRSSRSSCSRCPSWSSPSGCGGGPASSPGRPLPACCCWPSPPRPTGPRPSTRSPASPIRPASITRPRGSTSPRTSPAIRWPPDPAGSWLSWRPADARSPPGAAGGRSGWARRARRPGGKWSQETLAELLWWTAVALALRSVFEPVMVAYYLWPPLAVALIAACEALVAPRPDRMRRRLAHVLLPGPLAQPVELVDADGCRAGPNPLPRARPDRKAREQREPPGGCRGAGAARAGGAVRPGRRAMRSPPRPKAG